MISVAAIKAGAEVSLKLLEVAQNLLDKLREDARRDAKACSGYLEAAKKAIESLEFEFDDILANAKFADPTNDEVRRALLARIEQYLTTNRRRDALHDAIGGIALCRETLAKDAASFWQRTGTRMQRESTVALVKFELDRLQQYMDGLEDGLGGTGVEVNSVHALQQLLEKRADETTIREQIAEIQKQRERPLFDIARNVQRISHELQYVFV